MDKRTCSAQILIRALQAYLVCGGSVFSGSEFTSVAGTGCLFTGHAVLQIFSVSSILPSSLVIRCISWYWRDQIVNFVQAFICVDLLMFKIHGAVMSCVHVQSESIECARWIVLMIAAIIINVAFSFLRSSFLSVTIKSVRQHRTGCYS